MRISLLILFLYPTFLLAQDFKTSKAKEAFETYQTEMQRLEKLNEKADAKYEKDLVEAREAAMKAGNLKEAVLINSELEKGNSLEAKNIDPKLLDKDNEEDSKAGSKKSNSKSKEPIILIDSHAAWTGKNESSANNYKFDVQALGKKYTLKVYIRDKIINSNMDIFMTSGEEKTITKVGSLKADPIGGTLDISKFIKTKGPYSFLLSNTADGYTNITKVELVIE